MVGSGRGGNDHAAARFDERHEHTVETLAGNLEGGIDGTGDHEESGQLSGPRL